MIEEPDTTTATNQHRLVGEAVLIALGASFEQGTEELHERIFGTANGDDASYAVLGAELRALEAAGGIAARRSIGPGLTLWRLAAAPQPATMSRRLA